jgi:hypothetical protein
MALAVVTAEETLTSSKQWPTKVFVPEKKQNYDLVVWSKALAYKKVCHIPPLPCLHC